MDFSREELNAVVILGAVIGFIVGFDYFITYSAGAIHIDYTVGLLSLFLVMLGMVVSVYLHEGAHKWFARMIGYRTHTDAYYAGQVLGVAMSFFSFGAIHFFTPNTSDLEANPHERIHKHRKYENFKQQALIAATGVFATAVFAGVLHGAWLLTEDKIIYDIMLGNLWLMIYSLLPFELLNFYLLRFQRTIEQLPQSDGLYILHYSTTAYVTAATFALLLGAVFAFNINIPVWVVVLLALVIGAFMWIRIFNEN
jgi:hypothetical protein